MLFNLGLCWPACDELWLWLRFSQLCARFRNSAGPARTSERGCGVWFGLTANSLHMLRDVVSNWRFRRVEPHAWDPHKRDLGQLNACTDRRISNLRNSGGSCLLGGCFQEASNHKRSASIDLEARVVMTIFPHSSWTTLVLPWHSRRCCFPIMHTVASGASHRYVPRLAFDCTLGGVFSEADTANGPSQLCLRGGRLWLPHRQGGYCSWQNSKAKSLLPAAASQQALSVCERLALGEGALGGNTSRHSANLPAGWKKERLTPYLLRQFRWPSLASWISSSGGGREGSGCDSTLLSVSPCSLAHAGWRKLSAAFHSVDLPVLVFPSCDLSLQDSSLVTHLKDGRTCPSQSSDGMLLPPTGASQQVHRSRFGRPRSHGTCACKL